MDRQALHNLLAKYRLGELTDEETHLLRDFLDTPEGQRLVSELWDKDFEIVPIRDDADRQDRVFRRIKADERVLNTTDTVEMGRRTKPLWIKIGVAASILLALTIGATLFFIQQQRSENDELQAHQQEIKPGSDKARLVFDDGDFIELDGIEDGTVLEDKGVRITKREDGSIAYEPSDNQQLQKPIYNTIVTPRGGAYSIVLPDGSRVWMNAASKLKYPIAFASNVREVELEGEAYFEVVKKNTKTGERIPFMVRTHEQQLEVLGTSFNINSYSQNITTTLVEGAVALTYPHTKKVQYLKPSQQSTYSQKDKKLSVVKVDPYYTTAWKGGSFAFHNASIYEVMEDIARWYDIDVVYQGDLSDVRYSGTISRFENFKQLLQIIEWTDLVTFKIDGRRIVVMK